MPVYGPGCGGAEAAATERALAASDGLLNASANPATETTCGGDDPAETDEWTLARAIERAGDQAGRPAEA